MLPVQGCGGAANQDNQAAKSERITASAPPKLLVGVNTHFASSQTNPADNQSLAQQAGIISFRDAVLWSQVELTPGQYIMPAKVERGIDLALNSGMEPLLILCYGNKFYDNKDMPVSEEAQAAFVRYAEFVAKYYRGKVKLYEVWNEWNVGGGIPKNNFFVNSLYRGLLGRGYSANLTSDPEVKYWVDALNNNVITKEAVISALFLAEESQTLYPVTLTDSEFIDRLYANALLRPAEPAGKAMWLNYLQSGWRRADVVRAIVLTDEFPAHWRRGDAAVYLRLLSKTYAALKKIDPDIKIIGGAVTGGGLATSWLEEIIKLGAMDFMDAISVHPYNYWDGPNATPENIMSGIAELENRLVALSNTKKEIPIYITEIGWPNHQGQYGFPQEISATYIQRLLLLARTESYIKGIWWYDFQNDGTDPNINEHNFGLVNYDLTPKNAYYSLQEIAQLATYADYSEQIKTELPITALKFMSPDGSATLALWTVNQNILNNITVSYNNASISANVSGVLRSGTNLIATNKVNITIDLTERPKFIFGNIGEVEISQN